MYRLLSALLTLICLQANAQREVYDKQFFVNSRMNGNYFYSTAAYQSPSWIKNINHKLPVDAATFFTPGNALQLNYINAGKGSWNASVVYHYIRGVDTFTLATQLVFRLYIQPNTDKSALPFISIAKDSNAVSAFLPLQNYISTYAFNQWIKVAIPVTRFWQHGFIQRY